MKSKAKYFSRKVGLVINALGTIQVLPLLYSLVTNEPRSVTFGFVLSIVLTYIMGTLLIKFGINNTYKPDKWSGLVLAALIAILLTIPASFPYLFVQKIEWSNALFEATSGITTTGFTVFSNLDSIPKSLLLYRALTQWFGGALFLVFFVLVGFRSEDQFLLGYSNTLNLFKLPKQISTLHKGVFVFIFLYFIFTLVETIWYFMIGVPPFDAFAHSLTTVSSGGFSTFDEGFIQGLNFTGIQKLILIFSHSGFMLLSGISYFLYVKAVTLDFKSIYKNNELRFYLLLILGASILTMLFSSIDAVLYSTGFEDAILMVIGGISSVGIYNTNNSLTPEISFILLIIISIGGMIGSTAGGIKINRLRVVIRSIKYEADHIFKPSQVVSTLKLDGKPIDTKVVLKLTTLVFAWFVFVLGSWLAIHLLTDLDSVNVTQSVISALANGGFIESSLIDFYHMNSIARIGYVVIMIIGRLEIYPILVLFHLKAWRY